MAKRTPDAAGSSMFEKGQPVASDAWSPDVFPSRSHTQAIADVGAALRDGATCLLVTGVSGIGKTTFCRALAASADDRTFAAAVLDARLTADDVLAQLLRDFGLLADAPHAPSQDRRQLLSAMGRFLASLKPLAAHALVVVDDAERIAADVLSVLFELSAAHGPAGLRLVLVGQPSLEARLEEPALQSVGASATTRVRLIPLDLDEILPYVIHRAVPGSNGAAAATLTQARVAEVHEQAEGIPSRVNFFVARAMQHGPVTDAARPVDAPAIEADGILPARATAASGRLPILAIVLLLVVGLGWWWTTGRGTEPAPPAGRSQSSPVPRAEPQAPPATSSPAPPIAAPTVGGTAPNAPPPSPVTGALSPATPGSPGEPAAASPTAPPGTSSAAGPYRITIASFRTAARADAVAEQLRQKLAITTREDRTGVWHQVIAGPFPTLEAARDAQRTLTSSGFPETQITLPPGPATAADR